MYRRKRRVWDAILGETLFFLAESDTSFERALGLSTKGSPESRNARPGAQGYGAVRHANVRTAQPPQPIKRAGGLAKKF
jgi:hypothetical protein